MRALNIAYFEKFKGTITDRYKDFKISVLMSVYNGDIYLDDCIQGILNQTFKDFEFLIINDGSTDNTRNIIEKYRKIDDRIRLVNQNNIGLTKNL